MSVLSVSVIMAGAGSTREVANAWLSPLQAACDEFEINTPRRIAALLCQIGVESGGLTDVVENLNYGAQGLANTWPFRYAMDPHAAVKVPNSQAIGLAHDPEAIANDCYAGRMGNGDSASGDGWAFIGRGPIEITGRSMYAALGTALDLDLISNPSLLEQPSAGARSAGWYWATNHLNQYADAVQITRLSKAINLGNPDSPATPNGLQRRLALYNAGCAALGI